jgi:hypothetical protein
MVCPIEQLQSGENGMKNVGQRDAAALDVDEIELITLHDKVRQFFS